MYIQILDVEGIFAWRRRLWSVLYFYHIYRAIALVAYYLYVYCWLRIHECRLWMDCFSITLTSENNSPDLSLATCLFGGNFCKSVFANSLCLVRIIASVWLVCSCEILVSKLSYRQRPSYIQRCFKSYFCVNRFGCFMSFCGLDKFYFCVVLRCLCEHLLFCIYLSHVWAGILFSSQFVGLFACDQNKPKTLWVDFCEVRRIGR